MLKSVYVNTCIIVCTIKYGVVIKECFIPTLYKKNFDYIILEVGSNRTHTENIFLEFLRCEVSGNFNKK